MPFDVDGAISAGYSPAEIADHLGAEKKFDVAGARKAGYTNDDIISHLAGESKKKEEGVTGALKKGAEQLGSTARTAYESITGSAEEAALAGQRRQEEISSKYGEGASLEKLKQVYKEKGLLSAAGELAGQVPKAIAEQGANLATTIGSGAAGAAAGSVFGPVGTVIGGVAGVALPSFVQQYGGNIERQAEVQQAAHEPLNISRGKAAAAAVPQTALDVAQTFIPFGGKIAGKVFGPAVGKLLSAGEGAAANKIATESLLATVGKGTLTGIAAEVPTEVTQQMLERAQAGLSLTDKDAFNEYGSTAFAVSLLGPLGIIGRVSNKAEAGRQLAEAQQKASAENKPVEVPLQLTYDPNVPSSRGTETMIVFPDGRVAPSEETGFKERFGMNPPIPEPPSVTEAYARPEDKAAIEAARWEEARKNSPAMQKFLQHKEVVTKDQAARRKQAEAAFTQATPENGLYVPPAPQEPAVSPIQTVAVLDPVEGVKFYEGTPNKTKSGVNLLDESGKVIETFKDNKNVVINPTENDVFNLETKEYEDKLKTVEKTLEESRGQYNQANKEFKKFLQARPLKSAYYTDIINPRHNPNTLLTKNQQKGYFTSGRQGTDIDDLAAIAYDEGFLTEAEFNDPNDKGGVNALTDKIAAIYENQDVDTPISLAEKAKYDAALNEYNRLDDEVQRRKELSQELAVPTEEELARQAPEFVEEGQATPAAPDEYAATEPVTPSFRAEIATPFSDKFIANEKKLAQRLRTALDNMGLKDVGLKLEDAISAYVGGKMTAANGLYFQKMISLSLSGDNIYRSMNHEALHAMKDLGFFSDKDWKILEDKARSEWMDKYNIAEGYGAEPMEVQLEEAIAHAFADYQKQPSRIRAIMQRAVDVLKRIGNFFKGNNFKKPEDIFREAALGKLAATKEATAAPKAETAKSIKGATHLDPDFAEKIVKQFTQEQATVKEKFEGFKKGFFNRMVTGLFDEFRAIKEYSPTAYMQARLSKSIDGSLQGLLEHGQVYLRDGALDIRPNTKGLIDILSPLGSEVDLYQIWKALNRDANLPADKRSFPADLVANRDNFIKGDLNGKSRKSLYEAALKEEQALNKSVLDVAKETGLIDQQAYNNFSNDIYYIPFYKQMEGGDVESISTSSKLTGQYFSKALKGGEKKTNDLMENVLMNWSHILSAAMKNQAAVNTIKAAKDFGAAERATPMNGKYPPGTVKVMEAGKVQHYTLTDPDLVDAISTISYLGPKSAFLDVAKGFTNALRYGITLSPAYKVRNLIRDSIQSAAISELGPNMMSNVYNGLAMSRKGHPTFMSALAGGGIFEMGVAHEGNQAKLIKALIAKGVRDTSILDTPEKIKQVLPDLLRQYNELGNKFENANRLALYQKLIDSDKTHLEASFAARDLMDFSMQGQFRAVKVIGSVVPFFNARLQGLYKLGRDGITPTYRVICNATTGAPLEVGDKQKAARFTVISSAVMLASMALYSMYKDDEEFKRREDWDRDNFWWFKVGDTAFRIPKPFEIGALGTVAERTLEQISDEGVEGKVFFQRMNSILMNTFSMNPMPQMFKPLIDIYANQDSFTGAPIESAGMERLSKQERQTDKTSGIAKALGGVSAGAHKVLTFNPDAEGFSPIQVDYMIKGYLGWAGATAVSTADRAVEPFQEGTKVHPPIIDQLAMGFIKTEPETRSKYLTNFYQNNANFQSALADMRHYAELGESEKVQKILEEKGDQIALSKVYDKTTKQLASIRQQVKAIEANPNIPEDEKRAEMNRLKILMSDLAKQVEDLRISIKK